MSAEIKGVTAWFASNPVAANILALAIVMGGLFTIPVVRKEVFPEVEPNLITITVPYPGATPSEVEDGVIKRIEERVEGVTGVDRVTATATEGIGAVTIETLLEADVEKVLDDVKSAIDGITSFPEEIEEPVIQRPELRREVIKVAISGNADERTLKALGEFHRDRIAALPGITQVTLSSVRPFEVAIEVSEETLRRHGLTFQQVADAVRRSSLDLPAGEIKADERRSLIRTLGQAYRGREFADIVLLTHPNGTRITVGQVATVVDGFADVDMESWFDGQPGVILKVFRVGNQDALGITSNVRQYVEDEKPHLPKGIELTTWRDESIILRGRLSLLLRNAAMGFALVFIVLSLFLKMRLAIWVTLGIPISFLGAVALMPAFDISINLISLFAFIVVLGIVVDDAIVVGENVYLHYEKEKSPLLASIKGAKEVSVPVVFAVLTTVVAFLPMFNVPGTDAQVWRVIPLIVIPVLLFSLIESKLILPAHLSYVKPKDPGRKRMIVVRAWETVQNASSNGLQWLIRRVYEPGLEFSLRWRYATLAGAVAILAVTLAVAVLGYVPFKFFPVVEGDNAVATLEMPQGTPVTVTSKLIRQIREAGEEVREELDAEGVLDRSIVEHSLTVVGSLPTQLEQQRNAGDTSSSQSSGGHMAEVNFQLIPSEERASGSEEFVRRWRNKIGTIPNAEKLTFSTALFSTGNDIEVQLSHDDMDILQAAAEELKQQLTAYAGVKEIADSFKPGKQEIKLHIKPSAEVLGLTLVDLARQVRQAFYGEEAQRIQRGREEVKVMVRYPEARRTSLADLENLRIRTADGSEVPFHEVANAEYSRGYATIRRADRKRIISVTADVDELEPGAESADKINQDLAATALPNLMNRYNGLTYRFEGDQKKKGETLAGLISGFAFALFLMYGLMAIPFRSYLQPLLVMSAIPFGFVGAIWGHALMGFEISIMSMFGIIALSGVVVNDSLVLVDFVNRNRKSKKDLLTAVQAAGSRRFRPILLTSLTTFAGLTPLMLERSVQAQFLIPMGVSLAFGVVFATVISLVLVPCLYMVLEDIKNGLAWYFGKAKPTEELEVARSER